MIKIFSNDCIHVPEKVVTDNPGKILSINFFDKHISPEEIEVNQRAFYDLGFDPDFSIDGNIFYKEQPNLEQPNFNFFHFLIKMVYNTIKYFLQTPKERAFQELIKIEKIWHESGLEKGMLYPSDNDLKGIWQSLIMPHMCHLREYQFFKKLSKIDNPSETYAAELLRPLHLFNRPQSPSQDSKELLLKGECLKNRDVARLGGWGFDRLSDHAKQPIRHKEFLEAVHISGDQLKLAIRDLRSVIRKQNYNEFTNVLESFRKTWGNYINSHTLLKDLSALYSQEDYFKEMYKAYEEDYQKMKKLDFSDDEGNFVEIRHEAGNKTRELFNAAYEHLKEKNELTRGIANSL